MYNKNKLFLYSWSDFREHDYNGPQQNQYWGPFFFYQVLGLPKYLLVVQVEPNGSSYLDTFVMLAFAVIALEHKTERDIPA